MVSLGLVSTIIPVYNRPEMLRQAVASVLAQTYRPIEVIVVDDGSTDETPRVAEALAAEYPGEVLKVRIWNAGPGPAREAGRLLARGEFLQYLDSDDLLCPGKFAAQVTALREHPECGVAYGRTRLTDMQGTVLADPFKWTGRAIPTIFPGLLVDRWWCTHTPLYRRSVCDEIGPWSDMRWSQDWEYDARIGALQTKLAYCPELVSEHRHHAGTRQTSEADWLAPNRLSNRVRLVRALFKNAEGSGIARSAPEYAHFARWCFYLARHCAAAGMKDEALECLRCAEQSADECPRATRGFALFRMMSCTLGLRNAGRLLRIAERLRRGPGKFTAAQSFVRES